MRNEYLYIASLKRRVVRFLDTLMKKEYNLRKNSEVAESGREWKRRGKRKKSLLDEPKPLVLGHLSREDKKKNDSFGA